MPYTVKEEIFVGNLVSKLSYNWKMCEIKFLTKFSSTWFAGLSIVSSCLYFFLESTKLNSIRKVLDGKVRNFSPTKISSFTVYRRVPISYHNTDLWSLQETTQLFCSLFLEVFKFEVGLPQPTSFTSGRSGNVFVGFATTTYRWKCLPLKGQGNVFL